MEGNAQIQEMVEQLDVTIQYWVRNKQLFAGGCVFAASVIASELERRDIPFDVVYYHLPNPTNNIDELEKNDKLVHVGINVDGKEIGDCGLDQYVEENVLHKLVEQTTSDKLAELYDKGTWNCVYNTALNLTLIDEIHNLFNIFDVFK